jgi:antirestriction protein ArdC
MNVYEIVTERIVKALEAGTVPWVKPWIGGNRAMNLVSRKPYRGVNIFLLDSSKYVSPYWATFNQIRNLGGYVKKGEKASIVVFFKMLEKEADGTAKSKRIPYLRYYNVFNTDQTEGLKVPAAAVASNPFTPIETCENIVMGMPERPEIRSEEQRAYYFPLADFVNMPKKDTFRSPEEYYSTLFHELTHSTGHESRLNREGVRDCVPFGSTNYSKEELVAEMGAAFLCAIAGIENKTVDNSVAYLQNWIQKLKGDAKLIVSAATQAQKAADFILNKQAEEKPEEAEKPEAEAVAV